MSAKIMLHLDDGITHELHRHVNDSGRPYVWLQLTREADLCFDTRAECDTLIKAVLAAKDMLAEDGPGSAS